MGEVYRGHHPTLGRTVAIKVLPHESARNPEFQIRFEREARTVATLRHPNIVNVFDYGESNGTFYMVMEYIEGQTLSDILHERKTLPLIESVPVIREIASALDYAHEQGVIHRDVKLSNIMLRQISSTGSTTPHQQAILTDFGLIKLVGSGSGVTQTGGVGTLAYMAPEQIMSAREVDKRADIYSLGVMSYQMLTGQLPFTTDNLAQLVFAHLQQPPPDPREVSPDLPAYVAKAILRAMAKDPGERPASASTFAAMLAQP
jgi:serine/threonine-protein kinase